MKILWTKKPNPVDWLIALATGEDCGHMALLFQARGETGVVFESNLLGCHPAFFSTWMRGGRKLVHELHLDLTIEQEDKLWELWVSKFDGQPYDFGGVFYLGWCKFFHRIFNTGIPERNRWAKRTAFFCDEVFQLLEGVEGLPSMTPRMNGMATPHDVWLYVQGKL